MYCPQRGVERTGSDAEGCLHEQGARGADGREGGNAAPGEADGPGRGSGDAGAVSAGRGSPAGEGNGTVSATEAPSHGSQKTDGGTRL